MTHKSINTGSNKRAPTSGALLVSGVNNFDLSPSARKRLARAIVRKNVERDRRMIGIPDMHPQTVLILHLARRALRRRKVETHPLLRRWWRRNDPDLFAYVQHCNDADEWPSFANRIHDKAIDLRHRGIRISGQLPATVHLFMCLPALRAIGAYQRAEDEKSPDTAPLPDKTTKGGEEGGGGGGGARIKPAPKKDEPEETENHVIELTAEEIDALGWNPPTPGGM